MFEVVKNGQSGELGIRNFITTHEKLKGTTQEKLDQMLIEYRHVMATRSSGIADEDKSIFLVFGIPRRAAYFGTQSAKTKKNYQLRIDVNNIPNYADPPEEDHSEEDNSVEDFDKIDWDGNLNEPMMRRVWEIARVATENGHGKLMTYSFRTYKTPQPDKELMSRNVEISKDETVPRLFSVLDSEGDDNVVCDYIHDHYTCKYDNMQMLRHLNSKLQNQQIAAIVADYCWGARDDIKVKYSPTMFENVIPMIARMSFLKEDGAIFLPHHPLILANVYKNKLLYRRLYVIDFVEKNDVFDAAHQKWRKIDKTIMKVDKWHKETVGNMDDTDEKTKEVKRTLSCSDLIKISSARYREAARMYAGHWDFVKKEEADKICWVKFQPKKCDL